MPRRLPPGVEILSRDEFIRDVWTYDPGPNPTPDQWGRIPRPGYVPGEHVSWIGPTGTGKTTLMGQLLAATATPKLPAVVLAVKPRDATMTRLGKTCGFRTVRSWPPMRTVERPNGWIHWPRHTFDPDTDNPRHKWQFRRSILDSYRRGNRILVADEVLSLSYEMGLGQELVTVWTRGRSMGCGLWAGTQKPTHVPLWMYSMPTHLFIAWDPDERSRKRLREISGSDPRLIEAASRQLRRYEWLYFRQDDRTLCIVGK